MISVNPKELGNLIKKSIATYSHPYCGICNGCSKPTDNAFSALAFWQTTQFLTNNFTSSFNLGKKNYDATLAIVRVILACPPIGNE